MARPNRFSDLIAALDSMPLAEKRELTIDAFCLIDEISSSQYGIADPCQPEEPSASLSPTEEMADSTCIACISNPHNTLNNKHNEHVVIQRSRLLERTIHKFHKHPTADFSNFTFPMLSWSPSLVPFFKKEVFLPIIEIIEGRRSFYQHDGYMLGSDYDAATLHKNPHFDRELFTKLFKQAFEFVADPLYYSTVLWNAAVSFSNNMVLAAKGEDFHYAPPITLEGDSAVYDSNVITSIQGALDDHVSEAAYGDDADQGVVVEADGAEAGVVEDGVAKAGVAEPYVLDSATRFGLELVLDRHFAQIVDATEAGMCTGVATFPGWPSVNALLRVCKQFNILVEKQLSAATSSRMRHLHGMSDKLIGELSYDALRVLIRYVEISFFGMPAKFRVHFTATHAMRCSDLALVDGIDVSLYQLWRYIRFNDMVAERKRIMDCWMAARKLVRGYFDICYSLDITTTLGSGNTDHLTRLILCVDVPTMLSKDFLNKFSIDSTFEVSIDKLLLILAFQRNLAAINPACSTFYTGYIQNVHRASVHPPLSPAESFTETHAIDTWNRGTWHKSNDSRLCSCGPLYGSERYEDLDVDAIHNRMDYCHAGEESVRNFLRDRYREMTPLVRAKREPERLFKRRLEVMNDSDDDEHPRQRLCSSDELRVLIANDSDLTDCSESQLTE